MTMSEERINNLIRIFDEEICKEKETKVDIPEESLLTDEQLDKAFLKTLKHIDNYSPSLIDRLKLALVDARIKAKGLMLPASLLDSLDFIKALVPEDQTTLLSLAGSAARNSNQEHEKSSEETNDRALLVEDLYDFLKINELSWFPTKAHPIQDDRMLVGLRHRDIVDYKDESLQLPEIQLENSLENISISLVKVARGTDWIKLTITSDKPFPSLDIIGINVIESKQHPQNITVSLENISK